MRLDLYSIFMEMNKDSTPITLYLTCPKIAIALVCVGMLGVGGSPCDTQLGQYFSGRASGGFPSGCAGERRVEWSVVFHAQVHFLCIDTSRPKSCTPRVG